MESGQSEEGSRSPPDGAAEAANEEAGLGRSYECMFCKRGFSTAQALGGHMNIHRRDRARIRHQILPPVSDKLHGLPTPIPPPISETLMHYQMCYSQPQSSSSRGPQASFGDQDHPQVRKPQQLNLFGEDLHLRPSSQGGWTRMWVEEGGKSQEGEDCEVDLELRLGHER